MRTTDTEATCPWCDRHHEAATDPVGDAVPGPGDVSICFGCGEPSVWDRHELRIPTDSELSSIMANPVATHAMAIIKDLQR